MTDAETDKKLNGAEGVPMPSASSDVPDASQGADVYDADGNFIRPVEEIPPESIRRDTSGFLGGINQTLQAWRSATLRHTPAFIVNHASNVIALMHVCAETLMLKSAGINYMQNNRGGDKANVFVDPANNIGRAILGKDRLTKDGGVMQNHWQARSTGAGFTGWVAGSITPESKENDEKIDENVKLYKEHPIKYFLKRAVEGLYWFNPQYKRQQIGLSVTLAGIFSVFSGFHNVNRLQHIHFRNVAHSMGGVLTSLAGLQLWFAPDREQGWKRYGLTMLGRLPLLPFTAVSKFRGNDLWGYYLGGQTAFQAADAAAYLLGGAEKRPDGTIVDHHEELVAAQRKYKDLKPHADKAGMAVAPSPSISHASAQGVGVAAASGTEAKQNAPAATV